MEKSRTIDGYTFEYNEECKMYECRGDVCYDDEHDEIPEEELWSAAIKLEKELKSEGIEAEVEYSEKGWVEVVIE